MNIGELFVSLGVKGSEKTIGAITSTRTGLKETSSMAFETKAALVGVMYTLERLFSTSGKAGTGLTNFTALVGMNAKTLQQYQYAARQVGLSNEEMEGTFKSLQGAMTNTLMGKGAPEGLGRLAAVTGNIDLKDIEEWSKRPELLLQRLQKYSQDEKNIGLRNSTLKSFGISDGMTSGLTRNAFTPEIMAKAPTYSDREIASLDKANIAWGNLGTKIEMAVGHFNAAHGGQLVNEISKMVTQVISLANAFQTLSEKAELFKWLGKAFEGWEHIFKGITAVIDYLNKQEAPAGGVSNSQAALQKDFEFDSPLVAQGEKFNAEQRAAFQKDFAKFKDFMLGLYGEVFLDNAQVTPVEGKSNVLPMKKVGDTAGAAVPKMPAGANTANTQNVEVNQTLNFNNTGADPRRTGDAVKQAVGAAFNQMQAKTQAN